MKIWFQNRRSKMKKEGGCQTGDVKQEPGVKAEEDDDDDNQATSSTDFPHALPPPPVGYPTVNPFFNFPAASSISSPFIHPNQAMEDHPISTSSYYQYHHQPQQGPPPPLQLYQSGIQRSLELDDAAASSLCGDRTVPLTPGTMSLENAYSRAGLVSQFLGNGAYPVPSPGGGNSLLMSPNYSGWLHRL